MSGCTLAGATVKVSRGACGPAYIEREVCTLKATAGLLACGDSVLSLNAAIVEKRQKIDPCRLADVVTHLPNYPDPLPM